MCVCKGSWEQVLALINTILVCGEKGRSSDYTMCVCGKGRSIACTNSSVCLGKEHTLIITVCVCEMERETEILQSLI